MDPEFSLYLFLVFILADDALFFTVTRITMFVNRVYRKPPYDSLGNGDGGFLSVDRQLVLKAFHFSLHLWDVELLHDAFNTKQKRGSALAGAQTAAVTSNNVLNLEAQD